MVRQYVKKRPEPAYTLEDIRAAVNDIRHHRRSYRQAAEHYNVPRSVLCHRITGRKTSLEVKGAGRPTALTADNENQLEELILARAKFGYPMDKQELLSFVKDFCNEKNIRTPFRENQPGHDWYKNFMKRHERLSLKKPQSLQNKRAEAADPFVINEHYQTLNRIVSEHKFDDFPELFFNCDETGFCTDPSKIKAIGIKSKALYQRIRGTGRENISVNCCVSADGSALPPHIIFQGSAVLARWTGGEEDFPGTMYSATVKGYMEESVFFNWFVDKFIPHVNSVRASLPAQHQNHKALLMYDGHASHISARLVEAALENSVILFRLPSHLTHRLQPLDFSVFGPLKKAWDRILLRDMRKNLGLTNKTKMTRQQFCIAIKELWMNHLTPNIIVSGFHGTGSLPVDPNKFPEDFYDQAALIRYKASLQKGNRNEESEAEPLEDESQHNVNPREPVPSTSTETFELVEERPCNSREPTPSTSSKVTETVEVMPYNSQEPVPSTSTEMFEPVENEHSYACPKTSSEKPDAERRAIDIFLDKIRGAVQTQNTQLTKERQIRLKQLKYGEVLTSSEVLQRLKEEEARRQMKGKGVKRRNAKTTEIRPSKKKTTSNSVKKDQVLDDDDSDIEIIKSTPSKKNIIYQNSDSDDSDIDEELEKELEREMKCSDDDVSIIIGDVGSDEEHFTSECQGLILKPKNVNSSTSCTRINQKVQEAKTDGDDGNTDTEVDKERQEPETSGEIAEVHNSTEEEVVTQTSPEEKLLGKYYAISCTRSWYVGRVTEILPNNQASLKFLERIGSYFRWPVKEKIETVPLQCFIASVRLQGDSSRQTIDPSISVIERMWKQQRLTGV